MSAIARTDTRVQLRQNTQPTQPPQMGKRPVAHISGPSTLGTIVRKAALPLAVASKFALASAQDYTQNRTKPPGNDLLLGLITTVSLLYIVYYMTTPARRR